MTENRDDKAVDNETTAIKEYAEKVAKQSKRLSDEKADRLARLLQSN